MRWFLLMLVLAVNVNTHNEMLYTQPTEAAQQMRSPSAFPVKINYFHFTHVRNHFAITVFKDCPWGRAPRDSLRPGPALFITLFLSLPLSVNEFPVFIADGLLLLNVVFSLGIKISFNN